MSAFIWPLNDLWTLDQPGTLVVDTTVEGAFLVSYRSLGVGSASHYVGRYDSLGRLSVLCSFGERGHSHPLWWRARLFRALLWPLFDRSEWAQTATVVVGKTVKGAAPESSCLFSVV